MKSFLLSILFLISPTFIFSQTDNDKIVYFDNSWKETSDSDYSFYRIIKNYSDTLPKTFYDFEDYYKSGKIQMRGKSSNKEKLTQEGEFTYYYENGNKKTVNNYKNGSISGKYTSWYEDGSKQLEAEYIQNQYDKTKPFVFKIYQFWNIEKKQTVIEGNGYLDSQDEKKTEKGSVKNGLKDGEWTGSDKILDYSYSETYKNGELISGESIDKEGKKHTYTTEQLIPMPKKGMKDFSNHIAKNYKTPQTNYNFEGTIILNFIVEKDGSINEIKVVQSFGAKFHREAIRVLKSYGDWLPGKIRGIPARVSFALPINIKVKS